MKNIFKYIAGFLVCLIFRLLPFRPANIEPVMGTVMPFSRRMSGAGSFAFSFLSIVIYDLATNFGVWTFFTALVYGLIGLAANWYFRNRQGTRMDYLKFAIVSTLIYDAVTGLGMGPLLFHQTFMAALIGQIPFTARHLLGNVSFTLIFSPLIYRWIVSNPGMETRRLYNRFIVQPVS